MRNLVALGAAALVLALGVAEASAVPTTAEVLKNVNAGQTTSYSGFQALAQAPWQPDGQYVIAPHRGK
ncbi:MAG: hypothetical protein ACLPN5_20035 [Roseiarcus sp.]